MDAATQQAILDATTRVREANEQVREAVRYERQAEDEARRAREMRDAANRRLWAAQFTLDAVTRLSQQRHEPL